MLDRYDLFETSQNILLCELEKLTQKKDITPSSLEYMDKVVDIIKDLDQIMDNEDMRMESGYSQRSGSRMYNYGNSYRNDPNGAMYSRRMYSNREIDKGHSQGSNRESMLDYLYLAMDSASGDEERKRLNRMISEIENGK